MKLKNNAAELVKEQQRKVNKLFGWLMDLEDGSNIPPELGTELELKEKLYNAQTYLNGMLSLLELEDPSDVDPIPAEWYPRD